MTGCFSSLPFHLSLSLSLCSLSRLSPPAEKARTPCSLFCEVVYSAFAGELPLRCLETLFQALREPRSSEPLGSEPEEERRVMKSSIEFPLLASPCFSFYIVFPFLHFSDLLFSHFTFCFQTVPNFFVLLPIIRPTTKARSLDLPMEETQEGGKELSRVVSRSRAVESRLE